MKSRWFELKPKAIDLREQGISIVSIENALGIPRSTLSGWFKNIILTKGQKARLKRNTRAALNEARKIAVLWHNKQKENRLKKALSEANETLNSINTQAENTLDLALSLLYLGEGAKTDTTSIGNSDPLILKFFLCILRKNYKVPIEKIKCHLHIRADQNPEEIKKYWSETLKIPISNFGKTSIDKRTLGKPTYENYKGVCVVNCATVAIQRKLVYLSRRFCDKVILDLGG